MAKLEDRWLKTLFGSPGAVEARDIPYNDYDSIGRVLDIVMGNKNADLTNVESLTMYASPTGTGDGLTEANPTTLEEIRKKYSSLRNISLNIQLTEGEHVITSSFRVGRGSVITLIGDYSTWTTNPTVVCSPGATHDKIDTTYSGYSSCAAHTESDPFTLIGVRGFLTASDIVFNNNKDLFSTSGDMGHTVLKRCRVNMWTNDNISYNYAMSQWDGSLVSIQTPNLYDENGNLLKGVASDFSDNYGVFIYESDENLNGNITNTTRSIVGIGFGALLITGYLNFLFYGRAGSAIPYAIHLWNGAHAYISANTRVHGFPGYVLANYHSKVVAGGSIEQVYDVSSPIDGQRKFNAGVLNVANTGAIYASAFNLKSDLYCTGTGALVNADGSATVNVGIYGNSHTVHTEDTNGYGAALVSNNSSNVKTHLHGVSFDNASNYPGSSSVKAVLAQAYSNSKLLLQLASDISATFTNASTTSGVCSLLLCTSCSAGFLQQNAYSISVSTPANNYAPVKVLNNSEATRIRANGDIYNYTT